METSLTTVQRKIDRTTFQRHQFQQTPRPVKHYNDRDEGVHGLSYDDIGSFHIEKKTTFGTRNLETPEWALNDASIRDVIVRFMELRAFPGPCRRYSGTPQERLARALNKRLSGKPRLEEMVTKASKAYVAAKKAGESPARLKRLSVEIENVDTQLRFIESEHKLALGCIYRYYRCSEDSVNVAIALGIKPPHVRQMLWRLNKAARLVQQEALIPRVSMRINLLRGLRQDPYHVIGKKERKCWVCGVIFTPVHGHQNICGVKCKTKRKYELRRKRQLEKNARAAKRYFCSDQCKQIGFIIKKAMPVIKPGVGTFAAIQSSDAYLTYAAYCKVIGVEPMTRQAFAAGGLLKK